MSDEVSSKTGSVSETTPEIEAPGDFREYVKWRETGELPAKEEEVPAVAEETPQTRTEPESGPEVVQQQEQEVEEEPQQAKPGRPGSNQRRIDRLTREVELLKAQLAQAAQPRAVEAPKPAEPAAPPGKPELKNFQTLEAYQEALTDWKIDQRDAAQKQQAEQAAAKSAEQKLMADWNSSQDAARTAHPDYDEVVQSVGTPVGPGVLAARQAMLEEPSAAEMLYWLATHPDELNRIAQLQPIAAVREIGKLSTMFASPVAGKEKPRVSSAPKPPTPLARPSGQAVKDNIHDPAVAADFTRWNKARLAQLKER